ncbi:unnamed protein product, partial [Closterium sp. NIES-53]
MCLGFPVLPIPQVFYLEACESGSIFEGLLPPNIHIYATTAANAEESSWGTYCPGMNPPPPIEYETCLGDLYSVAWMEDRCVLPPPPFPPLSCSFLLAPLPPVPSGAVCWVRASLPFPSLSFPSVPSVFFPFPPLLSPFSLPSHLSPTTCLHLPIPSATVYARR